MRRIFHRLANLVRPLRAEFEMSREIDSHLALLREEFERQGQSPDEAALSARRAYGGIELAKELHREARSFVWIEQLLKDLRYAGRNLLRNPGFTVLAAIALTLGIGANATIFGIYNAVALKQIPVPDAGRVVRMKRVRYIALNTFAWAEYQYLREHNSVFSGITASTTAIPLLVSIPGGRTNERVDGYAVSANYFADLGVEARIGRTFLPDEDRDAGANTVVVLGYRFWQRKFNGDPNVVGHTLRLNGIPFTILGVAPREFTGTAIYPTEAACWAPVSMVQQLNPAFGDGWREANAKSPGFELVARLKNGVSRAQAQAQSDLLLRTHLAESREPAGVALERTSWSGETGNPWFQRFAAAVLIVVSLVLVVACANVANMLLARGVSRQREIAIRLALGGSRARVIRQLLAESILLSLAGGGLGILLSVWAGKLVWASFLSIAQTSRSFRADLDLTPDANVALYGLLLSLFTGLIFGLVPALESTRTDLHTAVHQAGSAFGRWPGRSRLRGWLLGSQVAVSMLLLVVSSGLLNGLLASFVKASELGFETQSTYRLSVSMPKGAAETLPRLRMRLETLPELSRVAIGGAPLMEVLQLEMQAGHWTGQSALSLASDRYFDTLNFHLLRGRTFTRPESDSGAAVAVVSESTARRVWPGLDPLGQHVTLKGLPLKSPRYEVVGVVNDARFLAITQTDPVHVYLPDAALSRVLGGIVFRIQGDRDKALAAVESAVESVDPSLLPGMVIFSLESGPVALQRNFLRMLSAFAAVLSFLALALAAVGIYGVMAFLVSRRTREIGIRIAMGATSREVLRGVVADGLRPVAIGTVAGAALGVRALTMADASPLHFFTGGAIGPSQFGAVGLMLAVALVSCIVPARRAVRVDPVVALRHE